MHPCLPSRPAPELRICWALLHEFVKFFYSRRWTGSPHLVQWRLMTCGKACSAGQLLWSLPLLHEFVKEQFFTRSSSSDSASSVTVDRPIHLLAGSGYGSSGRPGQHCLADHISNRAVSSCPPMVIRYYSAALHTLIVHAHTVMDAVLVTASSCGALHDRPNEWL